MTFTFGIQAEIKAIVFDCGGVIVQSDFTVVLEGLSKALKISPDRLKVYLDSEDISVLSTGSISEKEFWSQFARHHNLTLPEDFYDQYTAFIAKNFPADPKMIAYVESLKSQGFLTPMLSDVSEWQGDVFRNAGLYDHFDPVYLSYEIGLKKPNPKTFQYLVDQLNIHPNEIIFIDDRLPNVEAANRLGIHGIQFINREQMQSDVMQVLKFHSSLS